MYNIRMGQPEMETFWNNLKQKVRKKTCQYCVQMETIIVNIYQFWISIPVIFGIIPLLTRSLKSDIISDDVTGS